ncbi:MAG: hypothetical protein L0H83_14035, partial [Salinisphaera sp.]|nr:hypothetical protein [Salinisphaera sp.]
MIGKVIFVVIINVLLVFAFLRYVPVTGILQQRGFSQEQIQALLTPTAEEPITAESVMLPSSAPHQQTA